MGYNDDGPRGDRGDRDRDRDDGDRRGGGGGGGGGRPRVRRSFGKPRNRCRFCKEKIDAVDFKDIQSLQRLCTAQGKIFSKKRSGNCAKHQRKVKIAIKRARFMALLPFVG